MFEENQMGLFGEIPAEEKAAEAPKVPAAPKEKVKRAAVPATPAAAAIAAMTAASAMDPVRRAPKKTKPQPQKVVAAPRKVSGLVPEGDVRLTANIRQDLHLKLKITSAYRRTTIGELIEELVEKYL